MRQLLWGPLPDVSMEEFLITTKPLGQSYGQTIGSLGGMHQCYVQIVDTVPQWHLSMEACSNAVCNF